MKITILGLGYVGLPLALELSKKYSVLGFDTDKVKINNLNHNYNPVEGKKFKKNKNILFSTNQNLIRDNNIHIICVPTPIYKNNKPDLRLLSGAFKMLGKLIKKRDLVISESTVYPGLTNYLARKYLEKKNFQLNKNFYLGYSPERINPGDKINKINNIYKVISSESTFALKTMRKVYSTVTKKIHSVKQIEIAEASKAIENAQRDINIAFINEVSKTLIKNNIPVYEVLKAAGTKWNFLKFQPGLVGGHCIGVDPYYLNFYAKKSKINPKVIIAGREVNDSMPDFYLNLFLKKLYERKLKKYSILFLGITFKENINDFRNSKPLEVAKALNKNKKINLEIVDPYVEKEVFFNENKIVINKNVSKKKYDAIFLGVKHDFFKKLKLENKIKKDGFIFDIFNFLKIKSSKSKFNFKTI